MNSVAQVYLLVIHRVNVEAALKNDILFPLSIRDPGHLENLVFGRFRIDKLLQNLRDFELALVFLRFQHAAK